MIKIESLLKVILGILVGILLTLSFCVAIFTIQNRRGDIVTDYAIEYVEDKSIIKNSLRKASVTYATETEIWIYVETAAFIGSEGDIPLKGTFNDYAINHHVKLEGKFYKSDFGDWRILDIDNTTVYQENPDRDDFQYVLPNWP